MNVISIVSVAGGLAVAALSVVLTHLLDRRRERIKRAEQNADTMVRYRDPLLWAAFDLQSRLYNIVYAFRLEKARERRGFIRSFLVEGSQWHRHYALTNTAYVIAEYLCWAEMLRQNAGFLDLGHRKLTREVMAQLWRIGEILNTGRLDSRFRIFRGEQRAIGELMIAQEADLAQSRCMGYASFCRRLDEDDQFTAYFSRLFHGIEGLSEYPELEVAELALLQNELIVLIDILDPQQLRFPKERRTKIRLIEAL